MLFLLSALAAAALALPVPDMLPKGYHRVENKVVFVASDALDTCRLMAANTVGFRHFEEIVVGRPFRYSLKYGTKVFVVPEGVELDPARAFEAIDWPSDWPSCSVDIGGGSSALNVSSIHGRLTTVKLLSVGPTGIELERVDQVVSNEHGRPVNLSFYYLRLAGVAALGLVLLVTLRRSRSQNADSDPSPAEAH